MQHFYYPGCSLESTAREYDTSTRAVMHELGVGLTEIPDWTCCGASAAEATDSLLATVLPAVNLARAEKAGGPSDVLVPCSACYLNLKKAEQSVKYDSGERRTVNDILATESLACTGRIRPRHLLDILSVDIGPQAIEERVTRRLSEMTVALYYGCQCLRPFQEFDDPEVPRSMEPLVRAAGAKVHQWSMGGRCCGASHMTTEMEAGEILVHAILSAAVGADAIVTVCPMCQMNLDGYQRRLSSRFKHDLHISVLYLPQLLGAAMGISWERLGLGGNLALMPKIRRKLAV